MASVDHRCGTWLVAEKFPGPLAERWIITAAQINLYYPPALGKMRPKVVTGEVSRKGLRTRLRTSPSACGDCRLRAASAPGKKPAAYGHAVGSYATL
jgi:hypothetical protein